MKWESSSDHVREKEERRDEWDWRSSMAFLRFSFFESMSFRAAEIVFSVAMIRTKIWVFFFGEDWYNGIQGF